MHFVPFQTPPPPHRKESKTRSHGYEITKVGANHSPRIASFPFEYCARVNATIRSSVLTRSNIYIYTHTCVSPLRTKSTNNEEGGACTMTADTCTWRKRNHRNVITPFLERTMKYSSVPVLLPCTSLSLRGFCVCVWHRETGILNFEDRFCILEEEIGFAFLQFQVKSNHGFVNRGIMGEKSG